MKHSKIKKRLIFVALLCLVFAVLFLIFSNVANKETPSGINKKETLKIEDRSKAIDCIFRIPELNIDSNRNLVILMYNEIQRTKARLQEARQSVRLLEELLQQKEKEDWLPAPNADLFLLHNE